MQPHHIPSASHQLSFHSKRAHLQRMLSLAFSDVDTQHSLGPYTRRGHFISPGELSASGVWYSSSNFSTPR